MEGYGVAERSLAAKAKSSHRVSTASRTKSSGDTLRISHAASNISVFIASVLSPTMRLGLDRYQVMPFLSFLSWRLAIMHFLGTKNAPRINMRSVSPSQRVEIRGLEPLTPCMPCKCATSCAISPYFVICLKALNYSNHSKLLSANQNPHFLQNSVILAETPQSRGITQDCGVS